MDIPGEQDVDTGEGNSDISGASGEAIDDFSGVANGDISGDDGKMIPLVNVNFPCVNHHPGRVIGYLPCGASISICDERGTGLHANSSRRNLFILSQSESEILPRSAINPFRQCREE